MGDLPENLFDFDSITVSDSPTVVDSPPTSISTDGFSSPSSQSLSWWIEEIDGILMNDGVEDPSGSLWGKFLDDVLVQSPLAPADEVADAPNESVDSDGGSRGADKEKVGGAEANGNDDNVEDDDTPASKKKRRQPRNKDAALMPRERKKLYVRDLVAKSKYLERECRRLGRLLQGFIAENHNGSVATMTKQESAVLLLESLLLGSLLWFLGLARLFTLEGIPARNVRTLSMGSNQAPREPRCSARSLVDTLQAAGMGPKGVMSVMIKESGGLNNVGLVK